MDKVIEFLKGKKTYIVMIIGILTAIVGYVDGALPLAEFITAVLGAIGMMAMRAGVSKSG